MPSHSCMPARQCIAGSINACHASRYQGHTVTHDMSTSCMYMHAVTALQSRKNEGFHQGADNIVS